VPEDMRVNVFCQWTLQSEPLVDNSKGTNLVSGQLLSAGDTF